MELLREQIELLSENVVAGNLFPQIPTLSFFSRHTQCECNGHLAVLKTRSRNLVTMHIGPFRAKETIKICQICKRKYSSEDLKKLVPYRCTYGFDVIVYIGMLVFIQYASELTVQQKLADKNIDISLREIGYLAKRFIVYLASAHQECRTEIKQYMNANGGYILHLDGTCEGDSPHIFSSIDAISDIVLDNQKMATENSEEIMSMLRRIKSAFGDPLGIVRDMSVAITNAIGEIFPAVLDFICHYHFLRDIGKDLFEHEHSTIRRHTKSLKIRSLLRKTAKQLKKMIDQHENDKISLEQYLSKKMGDQKSLPPTVMAYIIIAWTIESECASNGYGFPFDQPHLDFYLRLQQAYPCLKVLKSKGVSQIPLRGLQKAVSYQPLISTANRMQQKLQVFNQLREAMRITCTDENNGLNDEGDADMPTIKKNVTAFRNSAEIKKLVKENTAYEKMVNQIDKYWDKLFADPISVVTPDGELQVQPQRTNNLLEQSFRVLKRGIRKKSGFQKLKRQLKALLADTPLIRNLKNNEYMEILLKGKQSLAERFAEIDIEQVRKLEEENAARWQKYPKRMRRLFKIQNLPQNLVIN